MENIPKRSLALDLGLSGKSAFSCVEMVGDDPWKLRQCLQTSMSDVSTPEVENHLLRWYSQLDPQIVVLECNGPGSVLLSYLSLHHPNMPILALDVGHPAIDLPIWDDIVLTGSEFSNIRAQEFWLVKLLIKQHRLKLGWEDAELFAQLTSLRWETDKTKGERIKLETKKGMRIHYYHSALESERGSRSPDKADALALSCFGYAMIVNQLTSGRNEQEDDIFQPYRDGFFPIGMTDLVEEIQ